MLRKLKDQKGIALSSIIAAVIIMVIISTMLILRTSESIQADRLNRMYNEIKDLQDNILVYYAKEGKIPNIKQYDGEDFNFLTQANINDNSVYYVIDANKLDNVILKNGSGNWRDLDTDDVYVVNESTLTVYYVRGVEVDNKKYYTIPNNRENLVNTSKLTDKKNKNTIKSGQGVVNFPDLKTGMTATLYNGSEWIEVEDIQNDYWYDYSENMFANMKLKDGSMYVWIPRFAKNSSGDIIFVDIQDKYIDSSMQTNSLPEGYSVDKIFSHEGEELSGIWVAKYEASENEKGEVQTIVNKKIWNNQSTIEGKCKNIVLIGTNGLDLKEVQTLLVNSDQKSSVANLVNKMYNSSSNNSDYLIMQGTTSTRIINYSNLTYRPIIISIPVESAMIIPTPSNWNSTIVKETRQGNVPIPLGFYYVGGMKDTGIVISDNEADENKGDSHEVSPTLQGNQFVWVPVEDISNIYDSENKRSKLYEFTSDGARIIEYSPDGYREPDVLTEYDVDTIYLQEAGLLDTSTIDDFSQELQTEYDNTVESIKEYKGFYVGRYETGDLSAAELVNKHGNTDISSQTWYTMYNKQKNMYNHDTMSVTSSMIWGAQWDAIMMWFMQSENNQVTDYIIDSSSKGNFTGSKVSTGSNLNYKVNNIYDMAGNVWEYTMEAYSTNQRVLRGGSYVSTGESAKVTTRGSEAGDIINPNIITYGTRMQLYLNVND